MQNFEKNLAEESRKIQKLRDKLRQQLDSVEQRVIERALKNEIVKTESVEKEGSPTQILSKTLNGVAK